LEKYSCKGNVIVADTGFFVLAKGIPIKTTPGDKCNEYRYLSKAKKCKTLTWFKFLAIWPVFRA
jgi:hypothetical protein